MPEDLTNFEVAVVFNGHPGHVPRILLFRGRTGDEAMTNALEHLRRNTTFQSQDKFTWVGPDGEAVVTGSIERIKY